MDGSRSHRSGPPDAPLALSEKARRTGEPPISFLIAEAVHNPALVNFAAGLVDPLTLPVDECREIAQRLLADPQRARLALQYGTTHGDTDLRRLALRHLGGLEGQDPAAMGLTPDDLVITTGSQQALYLMAECLLDPGDIVIAGNPSYFVFTGALSSFAADVRTVPLDEDGMDVEAVARTLAALDAEGKLPRVKFVYCTSYFQNPTGLTLGRDRRPRLLEIVRRFSRDHRILIVEDAAYRELRYDGPALPSIKSFDAANRHTVLSQTFSKPFSPGLKLGYTALPPDLRASVLNHKGNHDFGSSSLCQQIALAALADGSYLEHGELLRRSYRTKRNLMLAALDQHMPRAEGLTWTRPHGGLYVWLTLPPAIDASRHGALFAECLRQGVLYVPGDYCFRPDASGSVPRHHMRLSFGAVSLEQIEPGIARLAAAVGEQLCRTHTPAPAPS